MKGLLVLAVAVVSVLSQKKVTTDGDNGMFTPQTDPQIGLDYQLKMLSKRVDSLERQGNKNESDRLISAIKGLAARTSNLENYYNKLASYSKNLDKAFGQEKDKVYYYLKKNSGEIKKLCMKFREMEKMIAKKGGEFGGYLKEHGMYIKKAFDWLEKIQEQLNNKADRVSQEQIEEYLRKAWSKYSNREELNPEVMAERTHEPRPDPRKHDRRHHQHHGQRHQHHHNRHHGPQVKEPSPEEELPVFGQEIDTSKNVYQEEKQNDAATQKQEQVKNWMQKMYQKRQNVKDWMKNQYMKKKQMVQDWLKNQNTKMEERVVTTTTVAPPKQVEIAVEPPMTVPVSVAPVDDLEAEEDEAEEAAEAILEEAEEIEDPLGVDDMGDGTQDFMQIN